MATFTSNSIIKGATIRDLFNSINTIKTILGVEDGFLEEIPFDEGDMSYEVIQRICYNKILMYIQNEFSMEDITKEEFREKSFRGGKILNILKIINYEIEHCNSSIEFLRRFQNNYSFPKTLITYYNTQIECYQEVGELINEGILNLTRNRATFFENWVNKMISEYKK
ncbi:hypothetical protein [Virgibacillus halodenitrificans]|uniref:hypothetical protein n=1 Tax=Virgibacillus halodenitrificans TaxID=1482 RepID=UPI002DBEBE75|nr:hypothetical protein [Virgibacillus halodenitrificans]MEC2159749.1 hypothetical protein [Virgibacillus halodenitrificans]